jgi:hypothetical protein
MEQSAADKHHLSLAHRLWLNALVYVPNEKHTLVLCKGVKCVTPRCVTLNMVVAY